MWVDYTVSEGRVLHYVGGCVHVFIHVPIQMTDIYSLHHVVHVYTMNTVTYCIL